MKKKHLARRALALAMSCALLGSTAAFAQPASDPTCDEAFYATLDYYGNLMESSVVKSYTVNGAAALTDHGAYTSVNNLTDDRVPAVSDGTVTFDFGEEVPSHFYFEGKTDQPYQDLPWTLSLSYKLNGVPTAAEELAGKQGLVEIGLDALPNPSASDYAKDNLVLTAAAMFNADDILSLEAPGAQVQLIGNLRVVLFAVLPGEEQHFVIRVGSDDFSFSGMIFLAVPATLQQLDQVQDLREAKDKTEDSYDAINESLDVILDTLEGMSGSLNATASGLDQLNAARDTISQGKGAVYDSADAALGDLDALAQGLEPVSGHLDTASQAVTDLTAQLTALTDNAVALKSQLEETRKVVDRLQDNTARLREMAKTVEGYNDKETRQLIQNIASDAANLNSDTEDLRDSLFELRKALDHPNYLTTVGSITVNGMSASEIRAALQQAKGAKASYDALAAAGQLPEGTTFQQFLMLPDPCPGMSEAEAAQVAALLDMAQDEEAFEAQLKQMETVNSLLGPVNQKLKEANKLVEGLTAPTSDVVEELEYLLGTLSDEGFTDDLERLTKLMADLMEDMEDYNGEASSLLTHMDDAGDLLVSVSRNADTALDLIAALDGTLNAYVPDTQQALTDAKDLTATAITGIQDLKSFLTTFESLLKTSGPQLDAGTQQTLNGLSAALRRSTRGLDQTGTIRNAKATISNLIDDEWDSHTGGDNNLLLMDPELPPVSLTSEENAAPSSIQIIMRTQEIKEQEAETAEAVPVEQEQSTLWTRIKAMFVDLWNAITGIFRHDP